MSYGNQRPSVPTTRSFTQIRRLLDSETKPDANPETTMPRIPKNLPNPVFPALQPGQQSIPLYRCIGAGSTRQYTVIAYTIVDDTDYQVHSRHRWLAAWNKHTRSYYAKRYERREGTLLNIFLHREILGLPRAPGRAPVKIGEHSDGNSLNNTRGNLRPATSSGNQANTRRRRTAKGRFKGIRQVGRKFEARISWRGQRANLPLTAIEAEAAFSYNHAAILLHKAFAALNAIQPDEMPSPEDQAALQRAVEERLRTKGMI